MKKMNALQIFGTLVLSLQIAGCGGGGGSSTSPTSSTTTSSSSTTTPTAFTSCAQAGLAVAEGNLCFASAAGGNLAPNGFLRSVAFGNGMWVAVGSDATIVTSSDGATWTQQSSPTAVVNLNTVNGTTGYFDYSSVAYGNGLWVATGWASNGTATLSGVVVYSSDGVNWTVASGIPSSFHPQGPMSVGYGGGQWVVTDGSSGSEYTSTNGMAWVAAAPTFTFVDSPSTPTGMTNPYPLIFGNGTWLTSSFFTSTNALSWSGYLSPLSTFTAQGGVEAYGSGLWVGLQTYGAGVWTSTDAIHWTESLTLPNSNLFNFVLESEAYGNGQYVVLGNYGNLGLIGAINSQGTSWSALDSNTAVGGMYSAAYGNGRWVIVGASGTTANGAILVSTSSTLVLQ